MHTFVRECKSFLEFSCLLICLSSNFHSIPRDPAMMCFKLTNLPDNMYDVITISRDLRCKACNKTPKVCREISQTFLLAFFSF